jgi:maltose alpha-D-glucosyltransferase/alpha-amylase
LKADLPDTLAPRGSAADEALWYKDAVIYELHVKAFFDGNGDGIGDFRGLAEKLDYVQELGVNTIWLLPFYPSPLRDDGYDVADYHNVNPAYGARADIRAFIKEAHRRNLRVITELIVNHTSDQHPWFQAARRAPKGSAKRDFYVWSDDPNKYSGTRIIFTDSEKSNWSWDEVAQQYFWHRFFHHQPDLNFDNPHVRKAVFRTMQFWLDMGVDGFRLDAIPYLIERDGTSNENLRETHEVIKELRARLDEKYTGKLLLAEANMWPEDVREYFGDEDECHMAYHFPLMPRMYMAIAQEDRHPVVEILQQTPDIPPSCQWAVFLRNHDELTLEMVTSKERDYMYRMYAADPRARINLGIRRRLAPLMENDRDRIKLMHSLLLSMPGTPVLYYGDEIGMGDNIFLGDRDGVRTPMQWTSDRNGGFSRADPQRMYLPPIQDPIYGFEAINVEAQARDPSSLLNWTRRLLAVRSSTRAFGRGSFRLLHPGNRKVLAYLREHDGDVILCVANVGRSAQPVELDLSAYRGRVPVEMMGRNPFPPVGELPYLLTLPAHGFLWFRLADDVSPPQWHSERLPVEDLPVLVLFDGWNSFFRKRVVPWRIAMAEKTREQLELALLPRFFLRQRWYAGKDEPLPRVRLGDTAELAEAGRTWLVAFGEAQPASGPASWFVPLALAWEDQEEERMRLLAPAAMAKVRQQASVGLVGDALADDAFCRAVVHAIAGNREVPTAGGSLLRFQSTQAIAAAAVLPLPVPTPVRPLGQSSNTVVLVGDTLFLKAYRRVRAGINPEIEVGRYLTDVVAFPHCVPVLGSVEVVDVDGQPSALMLLQTRVDNQGDGWRWTVDQLVRQLEHVRAADGAAPKQAVEGGLLELVKTLARRTAQLHIAFAKRTGDPAFEPEPCNTGDVQQWTRGVQAEARTTLLKLRERVERLEPPARMLAEHVLAAQAALDERLDAVSRTPARGLKTRHHGDYHLGQVLVTNNDFVIIDFEGEPSRPLEERRRKHSALRDVAGMLRSFDYARHAALQQVQRTDADAAARAWLEQVQRTFLEVYRDAGINAGLYADAAAWDGTARPLLSLFEMEKALYEIRYELDNRPDWVGVPLAGLSGMLA